MNTYKTNDLALASAISLKFPLEDIDKTNPHKATFIFKRDHDLDRFVDSFWKKELKIEPLAYFNQLKIIKAQLYGQ